MFGVEGASTARAAGNDLTAIQKKRSAGLEYISVVGGRE